MIEKSIYSFTCAVMDLAEEHGQGTWCSPGTGLGSYAGFHSGDGIFSG